MSNYPTRTEILTAMRNPHVCYKSTELMGGSVFQKGTTVVQYSGGYTSVFPFRKSNNNKVAVRLWVADIGDAKRRSLEISNYLPTLGGNYFSGFRFIENAILINGTLHSIVVMDWVEGKTLKEYINDNILNSGAILTLASQFQQMVRFFHEKNIAHGDLQHGNLLVKSDGSLTAIDYDSMYIEPLDGMSDTIKGLEGYQHPKRKTNKLINNKLDYFSELIIYLSLLIFADHPNLWNNYYDTEDLLFSKEDLADPYNSALIRMLERDCSEEICDLLAKLKEELLKDDILELRPLEEILINHREVTKESIFDKMENQPNAPVKKEIIRPDKKDITNKF